MADQPQEIVIRDNNGTEHVFPAGFDPAKAAAIVSRSTDERPPLDAEAEGMMALGRRPDINAGAAAAGLGAMGAAVAPVGAAVRAGAQGLLRAAENPLVGGATGAYEGYRRGGIGGAIAGGLAGAAGSGLAGRAAGFLRSGQAANEAAAAASLAKTAPSIIKVSTPGLGQMFTREATGEAVQQAESAALRNQLLHQLASQKGEITPGAAALAGTGAAGLLYGGKKVYDAVAAKADELNHRLNPFQRFNDVVNPPR